MSKYERLFYLKLAQNMRKNYLPCNVKNIYNRLIVPSKETLYFEGVLNTIVNL